MNHCLNCGKECTNKFCSHECHQYYFNHNEEYKKAFIDKIKIGRRLAEKEKIERLEKENEELFNRVEELESDK